MTSTETAADIPQRLTVAIEQMKRQVLLMENEGKLPAFNLGQFEAFAGFIKMMGIDLSYKGMIEMFAGELVKHAKEDPEGTKQMLLLINEATGYVLGYSDSIETLS